MNVFMIIVNLFLAYVDYFVGKRMSAKVGFWGRFLSGIFLGIGVMHILLAWMFFRELVHDSH
jgi:hypothetical protein